MLESSVITLNAPFILILLVSIFIGAAAGYLGSFMVLRRMSLVGDVLTHVALPGMALAIAYHINPFWGAFVFLMLAVLGIWFLQMKTTVPPDALVGLFFTGALAFGILLFPEEEEALEALFGDITSIGSLQSVLAILASSFALVAAHILRKKLVMVSLSEDIARTSGIRVELVQLAFLLLVGLIVALGITFVGSLLMGALVIIPASAARNLSHNFKQFLFHSTMLGLLSAGLGIAISYYWNIVPGPAVILTGLALFMLTLLAPLANKLR